VPPSWPAEALKAQVIAARTYAVEKINRVGQHRVGCNCGVYASTMDQAYVGYAKESGSYGSAWKAAVDQTAALLATYNGAPIQAYYSSSDGGRSESNQYAWGGSPVPYLQSVSDTGDTESPDHAWSKTLTRSALQTLLSSSSDTSVGTLESIQTLAPYGDSGRVLSPTDDTHGGVLITGSAGTKHVSGERIRSLLGLKSTLFRIITLASLPDGPAVAASNGRFLLRNGHRLHSFSNTILVSWLPSAEIVSTTPEAVAGFAEDAAPFRDGSVLRDPLGRLWFVSDGQRRAFADEDQMTAMGYPTALIYDVTMDDIDILPDGPPMDPSANRPDGTFYRIGSPPAFWYIVGGKRYSVSVEALPTWRLTWSFSVPASDTTLAAYPDAGSLGFRDGAVLQGSDSAVWLVSGGQRRHFGSRDAFLNAGFTWSMIKKVSDGGLSALPRGADIGTGVAPEEGLLVHPTDDSGGSVWLVRGGQRYWISKAVLASLTVSNPIVNYPAALTARIPAHGALPFRDGTLIERPSGSVYLVSGGRLRPFRRAADFDALKLSWSSVRKVSWFDSSMQAGGAPIDPNAAAPEGSLVHSGTSYWLVRNGQRLPVNGGISGPVAASYTFAAGEALAMNAATASLPVGSPIGFRDGSLVKNPSSGTVYLISNGLRRAFTSRTVFEALGFQWSNVKTVADQYLQLNPAGATI
jgi:SpoIID/LytB domain protein